jgi:hypothetical protein
MMNEAIDNIEMWIDNQTWLKILLLGIIATLTISVLFLFLVIG